jgi:hypothetical protein
MLPLPLLPGDAWCPIDVSRAFACALLTRPAAAGLIARLLLLLPPLPLLPTLLPPLPLLPAAGAVVRRDSVTAELPLLVPRMVWAEGTHMTGVRGWEGCGWWCQ